MASLRVKSPGAADVWSSAAARTGIVRAIARENTPARPAKTFSRDPGRGANSVHGTGGNGARIPRMRSAVALAFSCAVV